MIAENSHQHLFGVPMRKKREDQKKHIDEKAMKKFENKQKQEVRNEPKLEPAGDGEWEWTQMEMDPKKETKDDCLDVKIKIEEKEIELDGGTRPSHTNENMSLLNQQNAAKHKPEKLHSCEECGKTFGRRSKLINHMRKHTKLKKIYECDKCGKVLSHRSKLIIHMRKHTGERVFSCGKCGKCFAKKSGQRAHEMKHEIEDGTMSSEKLKIYEQKRIDCEQCGKHFYNQSQHVRHIKGHDGIKDFQCDQCEKGFTSHPSLVQHVDVIHLGKRSFVCNECGQAFGRRATLKIHFLKHTKELPFKCEYCFENFRAKVVLKKHTRKTHPEKTSLSETMN